jgi:tRNA uridine 5-carbamoylmethylation protein Kti12
MKSQHSPQDKPKRHFLLDPEIANRVHSPFLNIMKRDDITSCVSKMKQIKKMIAAQHQKQEEIISDLAQDKEEHTKGKAKYIVMKKKSKSMGAREHTESTNKQVTAVTNRTDDYTEEKQELTTFQKLEALRARKPIHALMQAAAQSMPKNHFQEVKRQQVEMFQRENDG